MMTFAEAMEAGLEKVSGWTVFDVYDCDDDTGCAIGLAAIGLGYTPWEDDPRSVDYLGAALNILGDSVAQEANRIAMINNDCETYEECVRRLRAVGFTELPVGSSV